MPGRAEERSQKRVGPGHDPNLAAPLAPFVDALPVPQRLVAARQNGSLSVPIRAGVHRFHRDLPESAIWGYDGRVPGPTIEAERGQPVTVQWRNELDSALPVAVTTAPKATDTSGVPVQCVPGLSGGTPDQNAAALAGHTVVHLHGGLTPASYDGWAENLFAHGQDAVFHYPMDQRAALPPTPAEWRSIARKHAASWWEDWTTWSIDFAGELTNPPPLGSKKNPVLYDGPGEYINT